MATIQLTVVSQDLRNVTSRTEGFNTDQIRSYYDNPNSCDGTTIVEYNASSSQYGNDITLYGVSETTDYIAAGGTTSANTIFTVKKTFGWSGATGLDFTLPATANTTPYNLDLGAIVPANARIIDAKIINTEASVFSGGATTLVAGIGNATGGAQLSASATIYASGAVAGNMACINTPIACNTSASKVWVTDITPGANWSTQTAGEYSVYVTYNDCSSL